MKIYTEVVIDMETLEEIEAHGYDYEGPLINCGSTNVTTPPPPAKSPEEVQLERMQLEHLQRQETLTKELEPFTLKSAGLIRDETTGELRELRPEELDIEERRSREIFEAHQERQLAALAGELEISPALEKDLEDRRSALVADLEARLGPRYMETTAGQESIAQFETSSELLREEARRGQISSGEQILLSRLGTQTGVQQAQAGLFQGIPNFALSTATGQALAPYQSFRQQQFLTEAAGRRQEAQQASDIYGALIGAGGTAAAGGLYGLALASSKEFKEAIANLSEKQKDEILKDILDMDFVTYQYKPEMNLGDKKHVGVIAENVPEQLVTKDKKQLDGVDNLGYLFIAVQHILTELEAIKHA